jgi:methyl-accepting chemotaxis protein
MSGVMAASYEHSIGIEEVNRAIGQMDETTQHNAAGRLGRVLIGAGAPRPALRRLASQAPPA